MKIEQATFSVRDFALQSGGSLPEVTIAYETYGRLGRHKDNVILITHGITSSHHAAGRYAPTDPQPGWWDRIIGPGKTIDTDRYFVLSSNVLGSSYGSTAPASIDPRTGTPYGPDFPRLTIADMVNAQHALLASLGITHLVAVAGPSYGGFQAFQWGVSFPDFMDGLVVTVSAPKDREGQPPVERLRAVLAADPQWNDGRYYDHGRIADTMKQLRVQTLKQYGAEAQLRASIPDAAAREARLVQMAAEWAREFDANSMLVLRQAMVGFDTERDFAKIKAKLLYVLSSTDVLFPPSLAPHVMAKLRAAGVDATYFELESEHGHLALNADAHKWTPALHAFLQRLHEDD